VKIIPALYLPTYEELMPKCRSIYKYFFDTELHFWSGSCLKWEVKRVHKFKMRLNIIIRYIILYIEVVHWAYIASGFEHRHPILC